MRRPFSPLRVLACAAALLISPSVAEPQEGSGAWGDTRVLELVERARERRAEPRADSGLSNYQARAAGYVYFFLDREDTHERTLVKVDQIALDIFWGAPDRTKQRIVGLRDEKKLPSNIHYHLDHLTVVQDEFGDVIRLGDGDEVRDVLHPAAPGSDSLYQFRLADSLSIHLAGRPEPVRVYEIQVRPRKVDVPAFVGSVFVDRSTASIVRMSFTFTPTSYVDRRLDYIRISLDNALWEGRYWLPHEQKLEIRRQYPGLDFPAGGVIRGNLRIGGYAFNQDLPDGLFRGAPVVAYPEEMRERFPFEAPIYAGLEAEGLEGVPELERLRETAAELVGRQYLSGLPRLQLLVSDASSVLHFGRAEGLFLGAGLAFAATPETELTLRLGWPTAREEMFLEAGLQRRLASGWSVEARGYQERLRDLGPFPGAAGAMNTLHAIFGEDWVDPWFSDGAEARLAGALEGPWRVSLTAVVEEHRSASLAVDRPPFAEGRDFRPVPAVAEGRLVSGRLAAARTPVSGAARQWWGDAEVEGGSFEDSVFFRPMVSAGVAAALRERTAGVRLTLTAGGAFGAPPPQRLFLLGGRATLPGYAYRGFIGDRFALVQGEADMEILGPWVRIRGLAAAGWTSLENTAPPAGWDARESEGVAASAGAGLGLIYDVLRIDAVRGLNGGRWEWVLSVHPRLWDIL